jgi:hypothetical protein
MLNRRPVTRYLLSAPGKSLIALESTVQPFRSFKAREAGMSFPKKGKFFPEKKGYDGGDTEITDRGFAAEIAAALHRSLGPTRAGVKIAAEWTGANEKTVKNWFAGRYGPSGVHLAALARHSDDVLEVFLVMSGREHLLVGIKLESAEEAILDLLTAVRRLGDGTGR